MREDLMLTTSSGAYQDIIIHSELEIHGTVDLAALGDLERLEDSIHSVVAADITVLLLLSIETGTET